MDYSTSAKFDQIKLNLLGDSSSAGKPQLDTLFLSETFLKPCVPDSKRKGIERRWWYNGVCQSGLKQYDAERIWKVRILRQSG